MIEKIYYKIHRMFSRPDERGEYSAGYWQSLVRDRALEVCKAQPGRLLEVGCGEGLFLIKLLRENNAVEAYGLDIDKTLIFRGKQKLSSLKLRAGLILSEAKNMSFRDSSFDYAVCINLFLNIASLDEVGQVLAETARVLKPGGRLLFEFRNRSNILLRIKYGLGRYYDRSVKSLPLKTFRRQDLDSLLSRLGLKVLKRAALGIPRNRFAPIFMIEAEKC